ncbi:MAG: serine hydrolase domain-containing protein [Thermoanaerobaculales bacterium]
MRVLLQRSIRAGMAPGGVAAWGRPGIGLEFVVAGNASEAPEVTPMELAAWFDLASLTKPLVTTTLILLALRSRVLELETRVGHVLIETRGTDIADLSVFSLLTHTSGLPSWLPLYCLAEGNPEALPRRLSSVELEVDQGTRVIYSCVGFVILGLMLERTAGKPLAVLFEDEVAGPLRLENELRFSPDLEGRPLVGSAARATAEERLVREAGQDRSFLPEIGAGLPDDGNARFLGGAAGNAGLFGTARGVSTLAAEYLPGGGNLLTAEEAQLATIGHTSGLEQQRGLGWQLGATPGCSAGPALPLSAFGHTGFTGVSVWVDPVKRTTYSLLCNRHHPGHRETDLHPLRRRFHALAHEAEATVVA